MTKKLYKHYSFDLWMTLIRSDSRFKTARASYFYEKHNKFEKTFSQVENIIREIDLMCNNMNEVTGKNISSGEMYYMILHKMGVGFIDEHMIIRIKDDMQRLFEIYPPEFYDEDTLDVLKELKYRGHTLSITSNTGFIEGFIMRNLIDKKFPGIFDFQIYSDEVFMSKPNPGIFQEIADEMSELYLNKGLKRDDIPPLSEIIHIGDNPIADYQGANKFGIKGFLLNNGNSIKDLL